MSTHNILKQSLRHLSVSIHYLWGGGGVGGGGEIWWDRGGERKGDQ